jgi:hypothetical protein
LKDDQMLGFVPEALVAATTDLGDTLRISPGLRPIVRRSKTRNVTPSA